MLIKPRSLTQYEQFSELDKVPFMTVFYLIVRPLFNVHFLTTWTYPQSMAWTHLMNTKLNSKKYKTRHEDYSFLKCSSVILSMHHAIYLKNVSKYYDTIFFAKFGV